jgi:hypothetical protein
VADGSAVTVGVDVFVLNDVAVLAISVMLAGVLCALLHAAMIRRRLSRNVLWDIKTLRIKENRYYFVSFQSLLISGLQSLLIISLRLHSGNEHALIPLSAEKLLRPWRLEKL